MLARLFRGGELKAYKIKSVLFLFALGLRATTNCYSPEILSLCNYYQLFIIIYYYLLLFIIRGNDATEYWVLGCLCDGANVKKYKPVNEFMKSADFDVASEVQGICDPRCY